MKDTNSEEASAKEATLHDMLTAFGGFLENFEEFLKFKRDENLLKIEDQNDFFHGKAVALSEILDLFDDNKN